MADRLLFDTDVLVEFLQGQAKAVKYFESLDGDFFLSSITVAELWAGVKGIQEEEGLADFIGAFEVLSVDVDVAKLAGTFRNIYGPSHGVGLADAMIGATCINGDAILVTFNRKHLPMLSKVAVPYKR